MSSAEPGSGSHAGETARADQLFERLAADYLGQPGVMPGTGFGGNRGLRLHGRIFAMTVRGHLVVKLPAERVIGLVAGGAAEPFETAPGRVMRQWVTVSVDHELDWPALIAEAFDLARSGTTPP